MTKTAANVLGRYTIRVISVHPGGILTPMRGETTREPTDEDNLPFANLPLARMGMPHEVANISAFLAADEATYTTGAEFVADGGWNAGLVFDRLPTS
jgi:3alpha(or 20beta)-hydroxysteroid dehydrogenase